MRSPFSRQKLHSAVRSQDSDEDHPAGADLRARRRAAGLTQTELATLAGCRRGAVAYWERKPVLDLRSNLVARLAELVGLYDYATCTCAGAREMGSYS